jgi:TIR domain-containing protein
MPDQSVYLYDAFISNSPRDRAWVENTLLPRLHAIGLRVYVSTPVKVLDAEAREDIKRRIGQAHYVVAVLSPDSLINHQAQFERDVALERNFLEGVFCLLPIQVAPLDKRQIPNQIGLLTIVDFTQPDKLEEAFAHLLWAWEA